jgi:hypothetical protein
VFYVYVKIPDRQTGEIELVNERFARRIPEVASYIFCLLNTVQYPTTDVKRYLCRFS